MKKNVLATLVMTVSLLLAAAAFAGPQGGKMMGQMNCQKMSKDCPMSAEKLAKMENAVKQLQSLRDQMLAASGPATKKVLMERHLKEMESCLRLLPADCGADGCCARMVKCAKMGGKTGMAANCRCPQMTRNMMREMVKSFQAQMRMLD
jgi:hypothetical protein